MKTSIVVKTQLEALHCWPDVPQDHPSAYLANLHRHVFQIELYFTVSHSNRDLEFIAIKHEVDDLLAANFDKDNFYGISNLKNSSCEYLAEWLLNIFLYRNCYKVIVLEDGEMGAIVEA